MSDIYEKPSKHMSVKRELISFVLVIFIAIFIRTFGIELFFIPTGSMKQNLLEGDYVFCTKYSYGYSKHTIPFSPNLFEGRIFSHQPQRGDIIVFKPPHNMDTRYIKRLIGMPGDQIQIIDDVIHINGKPILRHPLGVISGESGKKYKKYQETLPDGKTYYSYIMNDRNISSFSGYYRNTQVFNVPQGNYFFIGDNRDESMDSRANLGFVPFENFIAKAQFIIFSTEKFFFLENGGIIDHINNFIPWISSVRFNRIFNRLYD
jgi:signal peptidase I